ncbi:MAG: hypothetical protein LUI13_01035 [Lachnospiraceae bacterium]|nr:hypothetical protein [Lachnospiraceae bacterium]
MTGKIRPTQSEVEELPSHLDAGSIVEPAESVKSVDHDYDLSDQEDDSPASQTEDGIMKVMMGFFTEEMLPHFGISQKVSAYTLTEEVQLVLRKGYQDFNFLMEDKSIIHFEFQSKNGGTEDLRRFRSYEGNLSYQLKAPVTTYVLFSGKIKRPMTELIEGVNTYKIIPIIMSKRNADELLARVRNKIDKGESLTRDDLVMLPLLPVFGGESSQIERIQGAFEITARADQVPREDVEKIEAAIYAMATKFLDRSELKLIKGGIKMTYLGKLLVEDGRAEERKNTERERLRAEKAEAELLELKKQFGIHHSSEGKPGVAAIQEA